MKMEYKLGVLFFIVGIMLIYLSVTVPAAVPDIIPEHNWCSTYNTGLPQPTVEPMFLAAGIVCDLLSVALFLKGVLEPIEPAEPVASPDRTQTIVPEKIQEMWFVYDWEDGLHTFDKEEEAHSAFLKAIDQYREEAAGDEWDDDVERIAWGRIFQTVKLTPIDNPNNEDLFPDDPDWDDAIYADAVAIEHRRK